MDRFDGFIIMCTLSKMEKKRKIALVVNKVSFAEAEEADINYWADLSTKDRVSQATEWIKDVWEMHSKIHGEQATLQEGKQLKKLTD